ncbi:MAG: hypothetical protein Q4E47_03225 [Candidatus Saccharibacteria bacterium]|nr:hypothetical protein [Candidatus Saccharibacteria bacterium]
MGQDKENPTSPVVGNTPTFSSVPQSSTPATNTNPTETVEEMQKRMADEARYAEELKNAPDIVLQKEKKPGNKKIIFLAIFAVIVIAVCITLTVISSNMGGGNKQNNTPTSSSNEKDLYSYLNFLIEGKESSNKVNLVDYLDNDEKLYAEIVMSDQGDLNIEEYFSTLNEKLTKITSENDELNYSDILAVNRYFYWYGMAHNPKEIEIFEYYNDNGIDATIAYLEEKIGSKVDSSEAGLVYGNVLEYYKIYMSSFDTLNSFGCVGAEGVDYSLCSDGVVSPEIGEAGTTLISNVMNFAEYVNGLREEAMNSLAVMYTTITNSAIEAAEAEAK